MSSESLARPSTVDPATPPPAIEASRSPFRACRRNVELPQPPLWSPDIVRNPQNGFSSGRPVAVPENDVDDSMDRGSHDHVSLKHHEAVVSSSFSGCDGASRFVDASQNEEVSLGDESFKEGLNKRFSSNGSTDTLDNEPSMISREFGSSNEDFSNMMCMVQSSLPSNGEEAVLSPSNRHRFIM